MTMADWIRNLLPTTPGTRPCPGTVYLDTETTGLGSGACIVEVAIAGDDGLPLVDTLVDPLIPIPAGASSIHGIFDEDVSGSPTIFDLLPAIEAAITGRTVVIYNSSYDRPLFPCRLKAARSVHCAMRRFKQLPLAVGAGNGTLSRAAEWAGHRWSGAAHRAMADALATRTVWRALEARRVPVAERGSIR